MATIRAKIPHRNIVSEPEFFKNQTTNYPSLVSRRKSSFEGLNFEEITSFRSLEDEYGTINGLSLWCGPPWKQHHTETYLPAIYMGWFLQNLSLQSSIFSLIPDLVSLLSDSWGNPALERCFFPKRVSSRSSRVPNQFNIIRFRSETGRNSLRYRGPVIWNFVNRLVKVPESFYSFKQILRKYVKIIDNFSFDKGATVVANKKDHFIYS